MNVVLANSVAVDCGAIEGRVRNPCRHVVRKDTTLRFREREGFGFRRTSSAAEQLLRRFRHREKSAV
jgi:hypothetical protein